MTLDATAKIWVEAPNGVSVARSFAELAGTSAYDGHNVSLYEVGPLSIATPRRLSVATLKLGTLAAGAQIGLAQGAWSSNTTVGASDLNAYFAPSYTGPLDIVAGAVVAYGQRALSAAKRGSALYTIRRSSDNTTQSFSSDATTGAAPTASITSFIGAGNGYVTTWNDQSGNGKDTTQSTTAQQPRWLSSANGGKPGFSASSAANQFLATSATVPLNGTCSIFVVFKNNTGVNTSEYLLGEAASSSGTGFLELGFFPADIATTLGDNTSNNQAGDDFTWADDANYHLLDGEIVFGANQALLDGPALTGSSNDNDSGGTPLLFAEKLALFNGDANADGSRAFDGVVQELLIYSPRINSSANRLSIRQNIATWYGITLS
jgi:hypothetical protein